MLIKPKLNSIHLVYICR